MSHCARILDALRDGRWRTTASLYAEVGPMILHSRISDLRHKGHNVEGRSVPGKTGANGYEYRLVVAEVPKQPRCPEEQDGNQCIHDLGHKGQHFAKDSWSYYIWSTPKVRRPVDHPPLTVPGVGQLTVYDY